jgi:hypothetical protein
MFTPMVPAAIDAGQHALAAKYLGGDTAKVAYPATALRGKLGHRTGMVPFNGAPKL